MSPLVSLTLLGFGVLLVSALLAWALLAPPRRRPDATAAAESDAPPGPRVVVTNDAVRGARGRAPERPTSDAFERFLEADREEG
jgi:hypothetical protein